MPQLKRTKLIAALAAGVSPAPVLDQDQPNELHQAGKDQRDDCKKERPERV